MSGLARVLSAARTLHAATPGMQAFSPWKCSTTPEDRPSQPMPALDRVKGFNLPGTVATQPLIDAIRAAADFGHWIQTYTEAEVGRNFLDNYGYYELIGPGGHFRSDQMRGYVAYWGPGLFYDWHNHAAEELYVCLGGQARFLAEGRADVILTPGEALYHSAYQPHAMVTEDQPILTFVLWRGPGLADLPRMQA
ncbi:dimethylsulfonioproprionate lyase family protein [Aliiroseovarius sp.]|uniref:dimethylsulfonioproprionate lyase family protein n=1 Tax=Aliiroseovarius sp. TaxID=1872442 RepID=UPI003BAA8B93